MRRIIALAFVATVCTLADLASSVAHGDQGDQGDGGACCYLSPSTYDAGTLVSSAVEIPPSARITTIGAETLPLASAAFEVPTWTSVTAEIEYFAVDPTADAYGGDLYVARGRLHYFNGGYGPTPYGVGTVYVVDQFGAFEGSCPGPGPCGVVVDGNVITPTVTGLADTTIDWSARVTLTVARWE